MKFATPMAAAADAGPMPAGHGAGIEHAPPAGTRSQERAGIDIVIPVYNAPADLARCVASVLAHTALPYRLVLIDDASPDPAIAAGFDELARRALPQVTLLRNETNLGFTGTANRGMAFARADVVLLNSDTVVTADWLDALARCAASDPMIGTITPFSNNAEICSFPRFCQDNGWSESTDAEPIRAALARAAVPTYPDIPTGVGFCLYVRRALIDAIGAFDPAFGLGYGEENDFCLRAARAGWRNVLCDDAFVLHLGGRSFEGRKAELGVRNLAILTQRYPRYTESIGDYIGADPLRSLRAAAEAQLRVATGPARGVLHIIHGHGGGTEHHARALIDASRSECRHYLAIAVGDSWQIEEHFDGGAVRTFDLRRLAAEAWPEFVGGICATFGIGLLHLHNISGCRDGIVAALATLGLPYGYTIHDLSFACPTILFLGVDGNYCHQITDPAACSGCLAAQHAFASIDIVEWRSQHAALVAGARFLIAPSRWAAAALERYFPGSVVTVVPHAAPGVWARQSGEAAAVTPPPRPFDLPDDGVATIAVLGAVGPDKGARRLERLAGLVRAGGTPVRFVLIGYMDVEHGPWQSDDAVLTIHGRYEPRDLPELLARYRARLVAFPSAGPETFSFTLSETWAAGLPVIVPPFGALAERVGSTGAGWTWTDSEWRDEATMLARMADLVAPGNAGNLAAAAGCARAIPQVAPATMTTRTLEWYGAVPAAAPPLLAPLDRARVRDALGYVPWTPPEVAPAMSGAGFDVAPPAAGFDVAPPAVAGLDPVSTATSSLGARIAETALWLGQTRPGRVLSRLAPARVRSALKDRLR